jgi:5-methyltetrahydrofolate--homocysteine methyltransferase
MCDAGEEAKKLYDEAQAMLQKIVDQKLLRAAAVVGIYPANSQGDDILVYSEDVWPRQEPVAVLHGLRQQVSKANPAQ